MRATKLYKIIAELKEKRIPYEMCSDEAGSVLIKVVVPDELWRMEFLSSDIVRISIYNSTAKIYGKEKLPELIKNLHTEYGDSSKLKETPSDLFELINELHKCSKHFYMSVERVYSDEGYPVMIQLEVFDQYWEVEFYEAGEVDIEIFIDSGQVYGEEKLTELFEIFTE